MKKAWHTKTLGEVCKTIQDGAHESPQKQFDAPAEGRFLYITSKNIRTNYLDLDDVSYVERDFHDRIYPRCQPRIGDVLLTKDGANTGNVTLNTIDEPFSLLSSVCLIKTNPTALKPAFLCYYLQSPNGLKSVTGQMTGAAIKRIILRDIKLATIPLPTLHEQQRIVVILDEAFDGIATAKAIAEKNLHNARALFESHLDSVFTQRGKGWVEKRLDEVCTFSSGGTPSKSNSSYWSGEIPWVSGRDMKSTRLSDSLLHISRSAVDESSTRMAPAGTLLILVRGMGLAHGSQIAELMVPCTFNQDIRGIHPEPDLIPRYLLFALRDRINSSDNILSSAAHGTLKIDSDELKSVMIPVLSRHHQQRIVTTIDSLSEETQRLESIYQQKLAALEALKKSILHRAFNGELAGDN
ncbi:MAG: restriction endonuclease subunit S [Nitrospira sp.]|nr:restriction endonuclease subunit S [Nitrospira sp.]